MLAELFASITSNSDLFLLVHLFWCIVLPGVMRPNVVIFIDNFLYHTLHFLKRKILFSTRFFTETMMRVGRYMIGTGWLYEHMVSTQYVKKPITTYFFQ